ncbi:MAG: hypothetical protein J0L88_13765 [Xanthomonadales bacterium]|nr:hypothetical protein [Xanthomonadales bacterium]
MSHWPNPISNLAPRLARAGDSARHALADAQDHAARGLDALRELSHEAAAGSLRVGRSARSLVSQRPVESVLLVAGVAFAVGWLAAWMRRPKPAVKSAPARVATKTARTTKR